MTATIGRDITTLAELNLPLDILPADIRAYVEPHIRMVEEVAVDLGSNLKVKVDGLRIDYPLEITELHLRAINNVVGRYTKSGRKGIKSTLHRVSGGRNTEELPNKVSLRVARVIYGIAEEMRPLIEAAKGVAVIGPPAVGKTTLLRDIGRIRLETISAGLVIVDSIGELCGYGDTPHPLLRRARIFPVGEPDRQGQQLEEAIRNHGAEEVMTDEVQKGDVPLLIEAYNNGVSCVCSLHGRGIRNVVKNEHRQILLGVIENLRDGALHMRDDAIFQLIIEVHGRGLFRVITDVPSAVRAVIAGEPVDYQYFGPWTETYKLERSIY